MKKYLKKDAPFFVWEHLNKAVAYLFTIGNLKFAAAWKVGLL